LILQRSVMKQNIVKIEAQFNIILIFLSHKCLNMNPKFFGRMFCLISWKDVQVTENICIHASFNQWNPMTNNHVNNKFFKNTFNFHQYTWWSRFLETIYSACDRKAFWSSITKHQLSNFWLARYRQMKSFNNYYCFSRSIKSQHCYLMKKLYCWWNQELVLRKV
jgi:hypothetical protein